MTTIGPSPTQLRFAGRPIDIPGTPESHWREWLSSRTPADLAVTVDRLIVLGAHPDDEVLGVGGIMSTAARAGVAVTVVCMSDGSGSHPGSATVSPERLVMRRHLELDTAATLLGLDRPRWHGLPDGELAAHHEAMCRIVDDYLDACGDESVAVLAVWSGDGHPDHEALGNCAREVCTRRGVPLWMYPIWMWHWATPGDDAVPWDRLRRAPLSPLEVAVKHAAVHAFASQVRPLSDNPADKAILPPHVLAHLTRPTEYVFT